MQSIHGLRQAILSRNLRHVCGSCQSFTTSVSRGSAKKKQRAPKNKLGHGTGKIKPPTGAGLRGNELCSSMTAAMARLPHPAVVITTLDRTYYSQAATGMRVSEMRHPIARAVTVSSLTSLSVRPRPHIMFNMTLPSTMYKALSETMDFNVHILTPNEAGARIANLFTRGNRQAWPNPTDSEGSENPSDVDADLGVLAGLKEEGLLDVEITNRAAWHEQYNDFKESHNRGEAPSHPLDTIGQSPDSAKLRQIHHVPCLRSRAIMEVLHCRIAFKVHPDVPNGSQNVVIIGEVVDMTLSSHSEERDGPSPVALGYADRKYRAVAQPIHLREMVRIKSDPEDSRDQT
ncbi:hypothetical protein F4777DRAFT_566069 [Nemania sp. FL0916]|nr:hypothetical protein F4777DRAFT_566069 [Nemania sp. FL0916]